MQASRLKSQFLASMSHELRTPLNSIIGFSKVLLNRLDGDLTERQETYIRSVHNSGTHLLQLINGILDFSRIEAGKLERSEEHTSELQSRFDLVCRLLLEKKKQEARILHQTTLSELALSANPK